MLQKTSVDLESLFSKELAVESFIKNFHQNYDATPVEVMQGWPEEVLDAIEDINESIAYYQSDAETRKNNPALIDKDTLLQKLRDAHERLKKVVK